MHTYIYMYIYIYIYTHTILSDSAWCCERGFGCRWSGISARSARPAAHSTWSAYHI